MHAFFRTFALVCALFISVEQAQAQNSPSNIPTLKLRCVGLSVSALKKAIQGTIVDQAKLACPTCKQIKARAALTYTKPPQTVVRVDSLTNNFELPTAACSEGASQVGPVCIGLEAGNPKLVAVTGANGYVGQSCQITDINTRIRLIYRDAEGKRTTKQLSTIIDLGGTLQ